METANYQAGDDIRLRIDRMAHGGEGIGRAEDGRIVFVRGGFPGDEVVVRLDKVKKSMLRGTVTEVATAGPVRVDSACPAAAAGAGCCDFAEVEPAQELGIKADVLRDQLARVGHLDAHGDLPELELRELPPHRGWRTHVRLGVDSRGRAGTRKRASNDLVTDVACTQLAAGLVDGIVGPGARTFTPGAEVIAVLDGTGARHVIETRKGPRGKRVEKIEQVVEGTAGVVEEVDGHRFEFPTTAFWQAHRGAPEAYTRLVAELLGTGNGPAWDLFGGVGLFVPTLSAATGGAEIYSVDLSPVARPDQQPGLADCAVRVKSARVEKVVGQLPPADAVVLDPPRVGAGEQVVARIADAAPNRVVHIGCDPAALSRDLSAWVEAGYGVDRMVVVNAFPGTHHFETLVLLTPRASHDVR